MWTYLCGYISADYQVEYWVINISRFQAIQFGVFRLHRRDYPEEAPFQSMPTTYLLVFLLLAAHYKELCILWITTLFYTILLDAFPPHPCWLISAFLQHQAVLFVLVLCLLLIVLQSAFRRQLYNPLSQSSWPLEETQNSTTIETFDILSLW